MKRILVFIIFCSIFDFTWGQTFETVPNDAFKRGEKLWYRLYYRTFLTGRIYAGDLTLEIKNTDRKFFGRGTYHIECIGTSRKSLHWIMNVDDSFESFIDEKSIFPWLFIRHTHEGNYTKEDEVQFQPHHNIAISKTSTKRTPQNVQDILSAFYFARTSDFSRLQAGDSFSIPIFLDDSVYVSAVIYKDKEVVKTKVGHFNCVKFNPMVMTGKVFRNRYPMTIWISDDKNKIPICIESSLFIGRIDAELVKAEGLANPMTSKIAESP
jgi:hypothetical protein